MSAAPLLTVCICTFKRPEMLRRLLAAIPAQRRDSLYALAVVVVDNDAERSAEDVVANAKMGESIVVTYCVQPEVGIARSRNLAVAHSRGELTAFIDDDEIPEDDWLERMHRTLVEFDADGVLGPVLPRFDSPPPPWVTRGRFFERPRYSTGHRVRWEESRTGNVLIRTDVLNSLSPVFREEFAAGGEDIDLFQRLAAAHRRIVWANDAIVTESVPPARCTLKYLVRSAALRGGTFADRQRRLSDAARSLVAVPTYTLALPLLALLGRHRLYTYLVKIVDHATRLLAYLGLKLVRSRAS
jgi:succinoglycan biosynthesis protein ExoM